MKNESQKLDDLPILVICQSGIYRRFPAKLTVLLLMEALNND